jgi:hypothetical protein
MIGITGSLALNRPKKESDLDFFIISAPSRIWTTRAIVTFLTHITGQRRHGHKITNRICLNSYLAENSLKIELEDLYSAYEYSRLIPILDNNCYDNFQKANYIWIKKYLYLAPFGLKNNQKIIKTSRITKKISILLEKLLSNQLGKMLEKILAKYQKNRIQSKIKGEKPNGQIVFNDNCLMFHPEPKGLWIDKEYKKRKKEQPVFYGLS